MRMTLTINIAVWHLRVHPLFSHSCLLAFFIRYVPFDISDTQMNDFSTSWMHENGNNNNNILPIFFYIYISLTRAPIFSLLLTYFHFDWKFPLSDFSRCSHYIEFVPRFNAVTHWSAFHVSCFSTCDMMPRKITTKMMLCICSGHTDILFMINNQF